MRLHYLLTASLLGSLACAPTGGGPVSVAPATTELRYRLVMERGVDAIPVSEAAAARMALGIERALAARGMLRAADWETPTLTVRFRMQEEGVATPGVSDILSQNSALMYRDRCAGADFTQDHCSQLDAVPVMPELPDYRRPGTVSLLITTIAPEPAIVWSESRIERTSWTGLGQRRADEIARGMVRDLRLTNDS